MEHLYLLLKSVGVFFLLVVLIQILKRRGIFNDSHPPVFNRLITELVLPITIFSTIATSSVSPAGLVSAGVMLASIGACCLLAYGACQCLKLSPGVTGSMVMLAGFGSTSTLAYPLIRQTFGGSSEAMSLGLLIGEFGVCIPFFTLGILTIAWLGSRETQKRPDIRLIMRNFLVSPIFISFVLGICVSQVPTASAFFAGNFWAIFFSYFTNGLEILVAVSLGLMLKPVAIRHILPLFLLIVGIKLFLQPLFVLGGATALSLQTLPTEILVIEAAMPSGAVAAVIADRYGCDGPLASALVVATYIVSLATIPLVIFLFT